MDEDKVAGIVQSFAETATDPSRWLPAMSSFSDTIGATCCALELADLNTGQASMLNTIQIDDRLLEEYNSHIFHINPRVARAMLLRVGDVVDDAALNWHTDRHAPDLLDWLERVPYHYLIGSKVLAHGGTVGFFTANFAKSTGPLTGTGIDVVETLIPHVTNFVAMGRALSGDRLRNVLTDQTALDRDRPFALLDRVGRMIECSSGFEAILRSRRLIGLSERRLAAIHPQHRSLVDRFLRSALGPRRLLDPPLPIRLTTPDAPRGLVLRAAPIAPAGNVFDIFRPSALITLTDLDQPYRVRRKELVTLFGLTSREADVAALVGEGRAVDDAARALGISGYTVRQHLKAVFSKMEVTRHAELVALVSRLA